MKKIVKNPPVEEDKNDRRILLKLGKITKKPCLRYFNIEKSYLLYYKTLKTAKPKGILNIEGSQVSTEGNPPKAFNALIQKNKKNSSAVVLTGKANSFKVWLLSANIEESHKLFNELNSLINLKYFPSEPLLLAEPAPLTVPHLKHPNNAIEALPLNQLAPLNLNVNEVPGELYIEKNDESNQVYNIPSPNFGAIDNKYQNFILKNSFMEKSLGKQSKTMELKSDSRTEYLEGSFLKSFGDSEEETNNISDRIINNFPNFYNSSSLEPFNLLKKKERASIKTSSLNKSWTSFNTHKKTLVEDGASSFDPAEHLINPNYNSYNNTVIILPPQKKILPSEYKLQGGELEEDHCRTMYEELYFGPNAANISLSNSEDDPDEVRFTIKDISFITSKKKNLIEHFEQIDFPETYAQQRFLEQPEDVGRNLDNTNSSFNSFGKEVKNNGQSNDTLSSLGLELDEEEKDHASGKIQDLITKYSGQTYTTSREFNKSNNGNQFYNPFQYVILKGSNPLMKSIDSINSTNRKRADKSHLSIQIPPASTDKEGSPILKNILEHKVSNLKLKFFFPKKETDVSFLLNEVKKIKTEALQEKIAGLNENRSYYVDKEQCFLLGYKYLWEFEMDNARSFFEVYADEDFVFELYLIDIDLMKVIVTGQITIINNLIENIGIKLKVLNANKFNMKSTEIDIYKCELNLIKGLLMSMQQNKMQAFLALRDSWVSLRKVTAALENENTLAQLTQDSQSRFYFASSCFNVGLSLMPTFFLKILELLGMVPNKTHGIEVLKKCVELNHCRSKFSMLLLSLYYTELEPDFQTSFEMVKKNLQNYPNDPLMSWVAALVSWRFLNGSESISLITRSIWNCGQSLAEEAYYLKFEIGWFNLSKLDWRTALFWFEDVASVALNLEVFDNDLFKKLLWSSNQTEEAMMPLPFSNLIEKSKRQQGRYRLVLPHKCCLSILIATAYSVLGNDQMCEIWMNMIPYIIKKGLPPKTILDDDFNRLCQKFLKRRTRIYLQYEVLYFVKEIVKVKEEYIQKMMKKVDIFENDNIVALINSKKDLFKPENSLFLVEHASGLLLKIIGCCLLHMTAQVFKHGEILKEAASWVPSEYNYILHHSFHWVGRSQMLQNNKKAALEYLTLSKKYGKCEFSLLTKTKKFISDLKAEISAKK